MTQTIELLPGIRFHCFPDHRFKQGAFSIQLVRPMCREEAAKNALLSAVLLRGCREYPDMRSVIRRLDDLYGASAGTMVRRVGDYQTTGFCCGFIDDRFALEGDRVTEPMLDFAAALLLDPVLEDGAFPADYVESEKKNLIATIEAELNDKRVYANSQMMRIMCREDSFGIPRLGEKEDVQAITAQSLYDHYRKILRESPMELFYVGAAQPRKVADRLKALIGSIERNYVNLPAQTSFRDAGGRKSRCTMDVSQAQLVMGFVTPITIRDEEFVAMQLFNTIVGSGMTSKLFMNIREKQSLCYSIGSGYHGSKGILTVSAGIDSDKDAVVRKAVLEQLEACRRGEISDGELRSAKEALCSSLRATHDSPGAIEGFYSTASLSGMNLTPETYMEAVGNTTKEQVVAAANTIKLHTVYFLRGEA